jgi:hypothetical protein
MNKFAKKKKDRYPKMSSKIKEKNLVAAAAAVYSSLS